MTDDKNIRDAFQRHADDVPTAAAPWEQVAPRIVRRQRIARASMGAAVLVAIVATAIVVPQLTADKNPLIDPATSGSSTPTPTVDPYADWTPRVGVAGRFSLRHPQDWRGGWFEGTWDYSPTSLPGMQEGGDTFAVAATLLNGAFDDSSTLANNGYTVEGNPQRREVSGRNALLYTKERTSTYLIDWTCSACPQITEMDHDSTGLTLHVMLLASNQDLLDRYGATGERILETLTYYDGTVPVHGGLSDGAAIDDFTRTLTRFMDARFEGVGAENEFPENADLSYDAERLYPKDMSEWSDSGCTFPKTETRRTFCVNFAAGADESEDIVIERTCPECAPKVTSFTFVGDGP